uniref:HIG1 domain-containing protein n=1 Tax=Acrobeloides nanus TaxID=290746 RepID=A0A914DR82_9BILA
MAARPLEKVIDSTTGQKKTVPMIPKELWTQGAIDTALSNKGKYSRGISGNFLVPAGLMATMVTLIGVIRSGTSMNGQHGLQTMARYRILAQGLTVCAMIGGAAYINFKEAALKKNVV